jgi:hypothetical protein
MMENNVGTMKKIFVFIIAAFHFSTFAYASVSITMKGQYFSPSEKAFKDIYGSGLMYGGEFGLGISRRIDSWIGGSYFKKSGKLSFTEEDTELTIIPLGGGIRFKITSGNIIPYLDAGVNFYQYKETNPIGKASKLALGFIGRLGLLLKLTGSLFLNSSVGFSYCKANPADFEINIGGLEAGIGLEYKFANK